jgi:hypothetical protein
MVYLIILLFLPSLAFADPISVTIATTAALASGYAIIGEITTAVIVNALIAGALTALSGLLAPKPPKLNLEAQAQDRSDIIKSAVATRRIIYGEVKVSGQLTYAASSDEVTQATTIFDVIYTSPFTLPNNSFITNSENIYYNYRGNNKKLEKTDVVIKSGQYSISGNTITLSTSDVGRQILVNYAITSVNPAGKNAFNHFIITLADHEVEEIGDIYINEKLANTLTGGNQEPFGDKLIVKRHLGGAGQVAEQMLIDALPDKWTSAHRGDGIAYIYIRAREDQTAFPENIRTIKAMVKGKKLFDPRTGLTAYSTNWALCVRDYVTSTRYGIGATIDEIEDNYYIAAANISDENVLLSGGITQKRYVCNGTIDVADKPVEIMKNLLTAGAGSHVYTLGKYRLFAGAYTTPTVTMTADDLRASVGIQANTPRKDLYNAVGGTFIDPSQDWQPISFPTVLNANYAAQDGEQIIRDIELPFTTDAIAAQRIAKIHLETSRQPIIITAPCKMTMFQVAIWDRIYVNLEQLGFNQKVFLVVTWKFADGGVDLVLREDSAQSYEWNFGNATTYDTAPNTNLPNPNFVTTPGIPSVTEELYITREGNSVKTKAIITWEGSNDALVRDYQLEYKLNNSAVWTVLSPVRDTTSIIYDIAPAHYDFRVKAIRRSGAESGYATLQNKEIIGLSAKPSNVTNASIRAISSMVLLRWNLPTDLDVLYGGWVQVRHSEVTSGALWEESISIDKIGANNTQTILPLKEGTYLLKFEDSTGQQSPAATLLATNDATLSAFTTLTSITESLLFIGSKTNLLVAGGALKLTGNSLFDDITYLDLVEDIDSFGGISASGTYLFASGIDLTTVKRVRLVTSIAVEIINIRDKINSRTGFIDDWLDFDGVVGGKCDAQIEVRYTNDNPSASPVWSKWNSLHIGDYFARAFEFRTLIASLDPAYNINVTTLGITANEII